MKKRPSIRTLIVEAHKFAMRNTDMALHYMRPLIIPIALMSALSTIGAHFSDWFFIAALVNIYFYGCFALAWHRAFLLGPKAGHRVSPFRLNPGDRKFIATLYCAALVPILILALVPTAGFIIGAMINTSTGGYVGILITLPIALYGSIKTTRWFFALPARSVNANVSFKEASRVSKGLIAPFIIACTITTTVIYSIVCIPDFFVMMSQMIAAFETGNFEIKEPELSDEILRFLLLEIPAIGLTFYVTTLNVGILSRLYQWAVQERG